jgi:hypothetical protein
MVQSANGHQASVHIFNNPVRPSADDVSAPRDLPVNVANIPTPFPFYVLAFLHAPAAWFVAVATIGLSALEFWLVTPHVHWMIGTAVASVEVLIVIFGTFWAAVATATSTAIVIKKTRQGRTEIDEQKWWRWTEARHWGNAWRKVEEDKHGRPRRRVIIIDAQEYWKPTAEGEAPKEGEPDNRQFVIRSDRSRLRPFLPERAGRPVRPELLDERFPIHLPSPAELDTLSAVGEAVKIALDIRDRMSELMKLAAFALIIGIALLFIFMGATQVQDTIKAGHDVRRVQVEKAAVDVAVLEALRSNNIYILPTPLATQIPVPGILEAAK